MFAHYVIVNGEVITVNAEDQIEEAVAVYDNKIVWTGKNEEARDWIGKETQVIDAGGASVLPGFIDAHMHMGSLGVQLKWANCSKAESIEDIKAIIKEFAGSHPKGTLIRGFNYDSMKLKEKRHPKKEELDEAAPEHMVLLSHTSLHYSVSNSKALAAAGITDKTPDPAGGYFERENGVLTGMAAENAHWEMMKCFPVSDEELTEALGLADAYLSCRGITSIHDAGDGTAMLSLLTDLKMQKKINTRIYAMLFSFYGNQAFVKNYLGIGFHTGFGSDSYKMGPFKLMLDGSGIGGTAALRHPYENNENDYGVMAMTTEEIQNSMKLAYEDGYQLTAHAIGDKAISILLDTYENLYEHGRGPQRDRVEHCYIGADDLFDRVAALSLIPVLQPGMLYFCGEGYTTLYGSRTENLFASRALLDRGIKQAFSSDCPVIDASPFFGIYAACARKDCKGTTISEGQKIERREAIRMYTINGAYASFEEEIKGSIEPGKLADIIILSDSILKVSDEELKELKVNMTMIDGTIIYQHI